MINNALQSITSIPAPFNMIVLVVLLMVAGGMFTTLVQQLRKFACHRQELNFKRDLLDRGLTAEEIEQIVRAHGSAVQSPGTAKRGCTGS
jgi:hypothetical protein